MGWSQVPFTGLSALCDEADYRIKLSSIHRCDRDPRLNDYYSSCGARSIVHDNHLASYILLPINYSIMK